MDLRDQIALTLQFLIVPKISNLVTRIEKPSTENGQQYVISIGLKYREKSLSSVGSNVSFYVGFMKAVIEIGEGIVASDLELSVRSGIAGGLIRNNIIERAKSELVERDAFLYHYRQRLPFGFLEKRKIERSGSEYILNIFEMASASERYFSCLASTGIGELNGQEFVHFGSAAGSIESRDVVIQKAIEEYFSHNVFHNKTFCRSTLDFLESDNQKANIDKHLFSVFDFRNITIFKNLMSEVPISPRSCTPAIDVSWQLYNLSSPLRGFRFSRAKNEALSKLVIGENETPGSDVPLYHPFW